MNSIFVLFDVSLKVNIIGTSQLWFDLSLFNQDGFFGLLICDVVSQVALYKVLFMIYPFT
ncbi:hypothetical protein VCHA38O209_80154 [Vibrio chagasii]|nr:hypothetical protein VCHA38O209_80154 [Vibrio chagasii]